LKIPSNGIGISQPEKQLLQKTAGYSDGELDWNYQKDAAKVHSSTLESLELPII
jgi:hypothetical protein